MKALREMKVFHLLSLVILMEGRIYTNYVIDRLVEIAVSQHCNNNSLDARPQDGIYVDESLQ